MFSVCGSNSISLRSLSYVGIRSNGTASDTDIADGDKVFWLLAYSAGQKPISQRSGGAYILPNKGHPDRNSVQQIADGIARIVALLRRKLPRSKILLLAIFPRGEIPGANRRKVARASKLAQLLDGGHYDVSLSNKEWERLITWMDTNAPFYGTFNPEDQQRQLRGERIEGPGLE